MKKINYILGYIVGAFLIILSLVISCFGLYISNLFGDTPMNRVTAPGEHLLSFDKPGKYIIYKDYTSDEYYYDEYYDDEYYYDEYYDDDFSFNFDDILPNESEDNSVISESDFSLINNDTEEKILLHQCPVDNDYNIDYEYGEAIFEFYIKNPGSYKFKITSNDESNTDKYTVTVLKNEDAEMSNFALLYAISIIPLVLGTLLITFISLKLRNDKYKSSLNNKDNTYNNNDPYDRFSQYYISSSENDNNDNFKL